MAFFTLAPLKNSKSVSLVKILENLTAPQRNAPLSKKVKSFLNETKNYISNNEIRTNLNTDM